MIIVFDYSPLDVRCCLVLVIQDTLFDRPRGSMLFWCFLFSQPGWWVYFGSWLHSSHSRYPVGLRYAMCVSCRDLVYYHCSENAMKPSRINWILPDPRLNINYFWISGELSLVEYGVGLDFISYILMRLATFWSVSRILLVLPLCSIIKDHAILDFK